MSANFYELLKYAKTGIASPSMTYFDRMRASSLMDGGKIQTLTGIPPLSFKANGKPLISLSMLGNGSQTGTPTHDAPIQPEFVGVRTGNLLNLNRTYSNSFTTDTTKWMNGAATMNNAGTVYAETEILGDVIKVTSKIAGYGASFLIEAYPNTTYTVSFEADKASSGSCGGISDRDINGTVISLGAIQGKSATFTTHDNCAFLNVCFRFPPADGTVTFSNIMLNFGSTPLPYEPYGYKIPLTNTGQTVPVYLGQAQTVRIVKKSVLTWEECNWVKAAVITATDAYQNVTAMSGYKRETFYCSHMVATNDSESAATHGYIGQRLTLCMDKTLGLDTVDKFREYLAAQYAAGTPVTVWYVLAEPETAIVNEPLCKIGDYADELHSTDAGVSIPTVKGQNTLTVDTELQPSEMTITYKK